MLIDVVCALTFNGSRSDLLVGLKWQSFNDYSNLCANSMAKEDNPWTLPYSDTTPQEIFIDLFIMNFYMEISGRYIFGRLSSTWQGLSSIFVHFMNCIRSFAIALFFRPATDRVCGAHKIRWNLKIDSAWEILRWGIWPLPRFEWTTTFT